MREKEMSTHHLQLQRMLSDLDNRIIAHGAMAGLAATIAGLCSDITLQAIMEKHSAAVSGGIAGAAGAAYGAVYGVQKAWSLYQERKQLAKAQEGILQHGPENQY